MNIFTTKVRPLYVETDYPITQINATVSKLQGGIGDIKIPATPAVRSLVLSKITEYLSALLQNVFFSDKNIGLNWYTRTVYLCTATVVGLRSKSTRSLHYIKDTVVLTVLEE